MGNFHEEGIAGLRSMEESGLLTRKVYAEVPPRAEYKRKNAWEGRHFTCRHKKETAP